MKRRSFIKKAVTGAVALGALPMCKTISKTKPGKLGVALVGLGRYSKGQLGPALLETKNCYLAGIVTGTPEKEGIWAEKYGIPEKNIYNYDNYDEIAKNKDIDIIYVVLPNNMHAEYTIRGLEAGKHVICEKPMSTTYADAVKMVDAAKKARKELAIGYRCHYEPYNLEMMRLGQKKVYGPITEIDTGFAFRLRDKKRWRLDKKMAGGGPLMDVGIYAIQGTIYTLGELPLAVTAVDTTKDKAFYGDVEGSLEWQFRFASKVSSSLKTSYEESYHYLKAKTATHTFGLGPVYGYGGHKGDVNGQAWDIAHINQQAAQMDAFTLNIKENTKCLTTGEMGARDMFIIEKIYESMAMGKEMSLKGLPRVQHLL